MPTKLVNRFKEQGQKLGTLQQFVLELSELELGLGGMAQMARFGLGTNTPEKQENFACVFRFILLVLTPPELAPLLIFVSFLGSPLFSTNQATNLDSRFLLGS